MHEFHYKYTDVKYDSGAKLLVIHADSFVYEIETMFMKIFIKARVCLILAIILKICGFVILLIKK